MHAGFAFFADMPCSVLVAVVVCFLSSLSLVKRVG